MASRGLGLSRATSAAAAAAAAAGGRRGVMASASAARGARARLLSGPAKGKGGTPRALAEAMRETRPHTTVEERREAEWQKRAKAEEEATFDDSVSPFGVKVRHAGQGKGGWSELAALLAAALAASGMVVFGVRRMGEEQRAAEEDGRGDLSRTRTRVSETFKGVAANAGFMAVGLALLSKSGASQLLVRYRRATLPSAVGLTLASGAALALTPARPGSNKASRAREGLATVRNLSALGAAAHFCALPAAAHPLFGLWLGAAVGGLVAGRSLPDDVWDGEGARTTILAGAVAAPVLSSLAFAVPSVAMQAWTVRLAASAAFLVGTNGVRHNQREVRRLPAAHPATTRELAFRSTYHWSAVRHAIETDGGRWDVGVQTIIDSFTQAKPGMPTAPAASPPRQQAPPVSAPPGGAGSKAP